MGQVTEFWKSAPSLLTFLDSKYALLRTLKEGRVRVPRALLTRGDDVKSLADRNHRISRVVNVCLGANGAPTTAVDGTHLYVLRGRVVRFSAAPEGPRVFWLAVRPEGRGNYCELCGHRTHGRRD